MNIKIFMSKKAKKPKDPPKKINQEKYFGKELMKYYEKYFKIEIIFEKDCKITIQIVKRI